MSDERLKIAVFIDFDNIEIGVKNTLGLSFDIGAVLEAIKERGEIITKVAYSDWKRGDYGRAMANHAVRLVQRVMTPGGDKNGADINLALDALEMAFTHDHINAFVIVGGDSDFITLVEKLKQYDKKVFVVGGRQFTSQVMQKNCTEFIAYENIARSAPRAASDRSRSVPASVGQTMPIDGVVPLVRRALKVLADREVTPQLGLLKSTLLQLDSSFSERDYGVSSFRDFAEKLAEKGIVLLKHTGRSTLVELSEAGAAMAEAAVPAAEPGSPVDGAAAAPPLAAASPRGPREIDPATAEAIAEGVELVRNLLADPPQPPRWPMYLRQIKQFIRASHPDFDDRKYGTIVDLMRACQKEGLIRLERDRQGGLRVFSATGAPSAPAASAPGEAEAAPATPPSSANVYRPKSVTLGWVISDDGEETAEADSTGEGDGGDDELPAQIAIAPIVPDDLEPEDDQSKFFAPGSAKEPISAGPVARGVKRGPRRTMSAEDAADRPKRARKAPAGGGGQRRPRTPRKAKG
ncbi:MAG: NYN domain-containing protein [Vicinamibacterales bacterium]